MKYHEIKEQVMSGAVGSGVHLLSRVVTKVIRRPMKGYGMIPFEKLVRSKKKEENFYGY
jgi:hypothetical protein